MKRAAVEAATMFPFGRAIYSVSRFLLPYILDGEK